MYYNLINLESACACFSKTIKMHEQKKEVPLCRVITNLQAPTCSHRLSPYNIKEMLGVL